MRMATRLATAPLLMLLALPLTAEQPATGRAPLSGVNIAGGEFNSARRPGVFGKDYIYPDAKTARPFIDMGMQIVRVPILWERAQPTPLQPLSKTEMALIDRSLASLAPFRTIVLDVHNYGRYNGQRLDQISNGSIMLADLWQRLAEHYKGDGAIAFGLMNEPFGMTPAAWRSLVDRSVAAIRRTGAANLILVPGSKYSGAHSWTAGGSNSNALAFANFRDPGSNYAFEMHQYLDTDSSGTGTNCVSPDLIDARLASATTWLRANGHRGYLGEFGVPPNDNCLHGLDILLTHLHANSDVLIGCNYWAARAWCGTRYPMSVQPIDGPRPQAAILHKYIFAREPR